MDSITVYVFLSETCPICQRVTLDLRTLDADYTDKGIRFTGIFPNTAVSTGESVSGFAEKYDLPFQMEIDESQELMQEFKATITPEVFVVRNSDRQVLYSGRIDNRYARVGKRRQVVTSHDLRDALDHILNGKEPDPAKTEAIGCYIMRM
jgi:peroxiredoxin